MPELPDICAYVTALEKRIVGARLVATSLHSHFLLRTVSPTLADLQTSQVSGIQRIGKRVVIGFERERFLLIHLMIAGRFQWREPDERRRGPTPLLEMFFDTGALALTEAGTKRRASMHIVQGSAALTEFNAGGVEPLECSADAFIAALRRENHTLKRSLTDPRLFSGIGNAYSDEILHAAQLSPLALTSRLTDEQALTLAERAQKLLSLWIERRRIEAEHRFPLHVTAFEPEFAVHGKFGQPCPRCGSPVQRIKYAENEANYCSVCQTGGRLLADRGMSRLLKADWPRSLAELEEMKRRAGDGR